jgi:hypothetical protein
MDSTISGEGTMKSEKISRTLLVMLLVGLAIGTVIGNRLRDDVVTSRLAQADGYPPPDTPTPVPLVSPTPDANGYLPEPDDVLYEYTTLSGSPYADLLGPLQNALDASDPNFLIGLVTERFRVHFIPGRSETEGGTVLGASTANSLLGSYFNQGSVLRIQGYYETVSETSTCVNVFVYRFQGTVAYPTDTSGDFGPPRPTNVPGDTAVWQFCHGRMPGAWRWLTWEYGEYYPMVTWHEGDSTEGPRTYYVVQQE